MTEPTVQYLSSWNGGSQPIPPPLDTILDDMENERDALIQRGRFLESTLMRYGRISRRAITSREEGR